MAFLCRRRVSTAQQTKGTAALVLKALLSGPTRPTQLISHNNHLFHLVRSLLTSRLGSSRPFPLNNVIPSTFCKLFKSQPFFTEALSDPFLRHFPAVLPFQAGRSSDGHEARRQEPRSKSVSFRQPYALLQELDDFRKQYLFTLYIVNVMLLVNTWKDSFRRHKHLSYRRPATVSLSRHSSSEGRGVCKVNAVSPHLFLS